MSSSHLKINLKNRLSEIPSVLDKVDSFFDSISCEGSARFDISLAVEELISNIIRYAYPEGETHLIGLTLSADPSAVSCEIVDSGRAFDPLSLAEPDTDADLDSREIGGLGVHIVRQTMHALNYERVDGKNILRMTHTFDGAAR